MINRQQQVFVDEYLIDLNGTRAYMTAYPKTINPKTASVCASKLLSIAKIDNAIKEAMKQRSERTHITQDRVLKEYAKIAFLNPKDFYNDDGAIKGINELTDDVAACIAGLEVVSRAGIDGTEETTKKIKIADKLKALQDVGKHLGMFEKDNQQKQPHIEIKNEMRAEIEKELIDEGFAKIEKAISKHSGGSDPCII